MSSDVIERMADEYERVVAHRRMAFDDAEPKADSEAGMQAAARVLLEDMRETHSSSTYGSAGHRIITVPIDHYARSIGISLTEKADD